MSLVLLKSLLSSKSNISFMVLISQTIIYWFIFPALAKTDFV